MGNTSKEKSQRHTRNNHDSVSLTLQDLTKQNYWSTTLNWFNLIAELLILNVEGKELVNQRSH